MRLIRQRDKERVRELKTGPNGSETKRILERIRNILMDVKQKK